MLAGEDAHYIGSHRLYGFGDPEVTSSSLCSPFVPCAKERSNRVKFTLSAPPGSGFFRATEGSGMREENSHKTPAALLIAMLVGAGVGATAGDSALVEAARN